MPCLIPFLLAGAAMWVFTPALALVLCLAALLIGLCATANPIQQENLQ